MPLVWRELFTRASLGRSGASKQLAPQRWPHPGRIIFSKTISLSALIYATDRLKSVPHSGAVAAKNLSHLGEAAPDFGRQLIDSEAPAPVAAFAGRHVHPGLAAQTQHVLQRNDRCVGDRAERQPDEIPVDLTAVRAQILQSQGALTRHFVVAARAQAGAFAGEPADGGVIVVRAGVDDAVLDVVIRLVRVGLRVRAESELQDLHSGKIELITQRDHLVSDVAEVFGDDRQIASVERAFDLLEKVGARPFLPPAVDRRSFARRDGPIFFKAAEMIKPEDVHRGERMAESLYPPTIAAFLHHVPAVNRITPQLARLTEVIRRDARDQRRRAFIFEVEEMTVGPDVGAVVRDEDRGVADDLDPMFVCVAGEAEPLLEKEELVELLRADFGRMVLAEKMHGFVFAVAQVGIPFRPLPAVVLVLDRAVRRVIFQPPTRLPYERQIFIFRLVRSVLDKVGVSLLKHCAFEFDHPPVINRIWRRRWEFRRAVEVALIQQPVGDQRLQTDQQRVSREGRQTRVRRIAVAGGAERQYLPQTLSGLLQEIYELISRGAQVANAEASGQ